MNDEAKTSLLIAHRGASAEAPENTLSAIRQAIALNADWIEIDIHLSKDGIPVVIHDRAIPQKITGTKKINIDTLTLSEIKQLDCGSWFNKRFANEKIPTLEEVLLEAGNTPLMIELKHGKSTPNQMARALVDVLRHSPLPPVKIGSFSCEIVQEVRKQAPELSVMGIVERLPMIDMFINKGVNHLAVWYKLLTPETLQNLLDRNIVIWTFTVDSLPLARHFLSKGVQGLITNRSRELSGLFNNKKTLLENC